MQRRSYSGRIGRLGGRGARKLFVEVRSLLGDRVAVPDCSVGLFECLWRSFLFSSFCLVFSETIKVRGGVISRTAYLPYRGFCGAPGFSARINSHSKNITTIKKAPRAGI